ncbi:MAG: hypothetical protein K2P51_02315 [Rhabdochlamydiaceae bacterium]|nr:hypothetical protein [Rhabdochlamydiaceae bacterium]
MSSYRVLRALLCFIFFLATPSIYADEPPTPKQELEHIDKEYKQLKDLRNKYKAAAARHQDEGMRWQFMQDYKQEAKRAFQQADWELEMVQELQRRMDVLDQQRAELLKENPELKKDSQ